VDRVDQAGDGGANPDADGADERMASGAAISTISMGLRKFLVTAGVMRSTQPSM
jgi:RecA/RadA recombinase